MQTTMVSTTSSPDVKRAKATNEKFSIDLLRQDPGKAQFDTLYNNEKAICKCESTCQDLETCPSKFQIDWLAFAAKLWSINKRTSTVMINCGGICNFRRFRLSKGETLSQCIERIKAQSNGLVYKLLDDFVTWCTAEQNYMPRSTRSFFGSTVNLFKFCEVEIDEYKLESIRLPKVADLNDEYPPLNEMRAIDNAASLETRGFFRLITNTGFEPVDAAELQVCDFYFDEEPARIDTIRKKTGKKLTGFLSETTAQVIKQIIANDNKQANDYVFTKNFTPFTVKVLSNKFKYAVCKAGFGKFVKTKSGSLCPVPNKIEGHTYNKYHLKVFKKRWFTMAVASGVPEYVAQGMLGRKKYLDEYMRMPFDKKREFAKKILKIIEIYPSEPDKQEQRKQAAQILGLDDLSEEQAQKLRGVLFRLLGEPEQANKLLGGQ